MLYSGLSARSEIFALLEKRAETRFSRDETSRFIIAIREHFIEDQSRPIRAENLTTREVKAIRKCFREETLVEGVLLVGLIDIFRN